MCVCIKYSLVIQFISRTHILGKTSNVRRIVSNMTNEINQLLAKGSLFKNRQVFLFESLLLFKNTIKKITKLPTYQSKLIFLTLLKFFKRISKCYQIKYFYKLKKN